MHQRKKEKSGDAAFDDVDERLVDLILLYSNEIKIIFFTFQ